MAFLDDIGVGRLVADIKAKADASYKLISGQNIQTINNTSILTSGNVNIRNWYGTCNSATASTTKYVTCADYTHVEGAILCVRFTTASTASVLSLDVNNTGELPVSVGGVQTNSTTNVLKWSQDTYVYFQYVNGTFHYITSVSAGTRAPSRGAATWYGTCGTGSGTTAKTATIDNYVLTKGSLVTLVCQTGNTVAAPTLNINSTGAKSVYKGDAITSSSNPLYWSAGDTLTFMYDGTYYRFLSSSQTGLSSATVTSPYTGSCNYVINGRVVTFDATIATTGALSNGTQIASGLPANHTTNSAFYALNNSSSTEMVPLYVSNDGYLRVRGAFSSASRSLRVSGSYIS